MRLVAVVKLAGVALPPVPSAEDDVAYMATPKPTVSSASAASTAYATRQSFYPDLVTTIPVTTRSIHRLLLTALVVSAKMRDDKYYSTAHYAKVGGVETAAA